MFGSRVTPSTSIALASLLAFAWASPGHAEEKNAPPAASGSFPLVETEAAPAQPKMVEPEPGSAPAELNGAPDAEEAPPATREAAAMAAGTPCVKGETSAPAATVEADYDAPFRAFATTAQQERMRRYGGAIGGVVAGGSSFALGAVLKSEENINPDVFYVVGSIAIGASLLGLFLPSTFEIQAKSHRADAPGHTADEARAFEKKWAVWAEDARRHRVRNAFGGMVLGAGFSGVGIALLAGAMEMSDDDRVLWGTLLVGSGVAMVGAGGMSLLLLSPMESSYRLYAATQPQPPQTSPVSLKLRPFGLGLAANGTF